MGQFTFTVTQELIDLMPELTEHNYGIGAVLTVAGQTYSDDAASTLDDGPGGSDPTKPRGKYP